MLDIRVSAVKGILINIINGHLLSVQFRVALFPVLVHRDGNDLRAQAAKVRTLTLPNLFYNLFLASI